MNEAVRDVFICHASEDKKEIVSPIVEALIHADISVWYDEAEIKWGDSITQKVNEGLKISHFVIVVLSPSFAKKNWPQKELNAALNIEVSTGELKVLPLLVGSEEEKKEILGRYPLLNDKRYLQWSGVPGEIVDAVIDRLQKKDQFLKNTFFTIKECFKAALFQLEASYKWIETDFSEIHNFKLVSKIYVNGEAKSQCKIWIGGISSSNSIAYQSGQVHINNDSSMNDWLSVDDDGYELGLKPSGLGFSKPLKFKKDLLNKEESAEYLWMRFTEYIS